VLRNSELRRSRVLRVGSRACAAAALVLTLAVSVGSSARAQTSGGSGMTADQLAGQFGGFDTRAHAAGMSLAYDSPGLIPGTPSPLIQVSLPESTTNFSNGPSGYALASLVYPGALLANLGPVLVQGGAPADVTNSIPPYPLRAEAFFPAGPTQQAQSVGAARMAVDTNGTGTTSNTVYGAAALNALLDLGNITTATDTHVEQGKVVSRARTVISGLDLLAGLVHIDSIVTDIVASSDAASSATAGNSIVSGATLLGLPITIDATGMHFAPTAGSTATTGPLGSLGAGLQSAVGPLNTLITSIGGAGADALNKFMTASGIDIKVMAPIETRSGAQAERLANGLQIKLSYDGKTTPVMSQLLALIPSQQLPSQGVPGLPVPNSPQAIVELLKATHIETLGFAVGDVKALASAAYQAGDQGTAAGGDTSSPSGAPSSGGTGSESSPIAGGGGFTTPTPALPRRNGTTIFGPRLASDHSTPMVAGGLIGLLLAAALVAWALSTRLASQVLAAQGAACPDGLDRPPPEGGRS